MPTVGAITLYVSLLTFTLHVHPDRLDYVDQVLGTASVVLAGLVAALKLVGRTLAEHRFLFLGAGETNIALEECRKEIWLVDSKGSCHVFRWEPIYPVEYNGKVYVLGQANNAYIFPGLGLGLIMSGTIRVHDDMLLAACACSRSN